MTGVQTCALPISDPLTAGRVIAQSGLEAAREAITRYRDGGGPLTRSAAATLTVMLGNLRVRDDVWARMDPGHRVAHLRLWTDVTRLAQPGYAAAPATLLAFTAWQDGDGALANVALDRALADNPRYSMALLLREALDGGAPPSMAVLPMTPEEVAASYDALDNTRQGACRPCGSAGDADPCDQPAEQGEQDAEPESAMA